MCPSGATCLFGLVQHEPHHHLIEYSLVHATI